MAATVYLLPVIIFRIQYIGGPSVGIKPFLEFGLEASYATCVGCWAVARPRLVAILLMKRAHATCFTQPDMIQWPNKR